MLVLLLAGCVHTTDVAPRKPIPPSLSVLFDSGDAEPTTDSDHTAIGRAVGRLDADDDLRLLIIGHTDSVGSDEANRDLAFARASAVESEVLGQSQRLAHRVRTAFWGESKPASSNDTDDGRALNRRVELYFYRPSDDESDAVQLQRTFGSHLELRANVRVTK